MPKLKNKSTVKKRFKITGSGKVKHAKAAHGHLLVRKSKRGKKSAKRVHIAGEHLANKVKAYLPMQ